MKSGGSKQKGTDFERQICKGLSKWVTGGRRDDCLWRSAMSGGRSTIHHKKGKELAHVSGDICAVHPDGFPLVKIFFIECKFYKDLRFQTLLTQQKGPAFDFWKVCLRESDKHKKLPMLILKQNMLPAMVALDSIGDGMLHNSHHQFRVSILYMKCGDMYLYYYDDLLSASFPVRRRVINV